MMKPDDVQPRMRNHYREEEYFSLNVRNGVIRNPLGHRIVSLPGELIEGLHRGLEDETGAAAPIVLYKCGRWWGTQFIRRHGAELRQFYGMDGGELHLHFYLQVLRRVWALYGWGALELSFGLQERGFLEIQVGSALFSETVGNIGRTADHLVAGVLASIASDLAGRDLECVETACRSKGDTKCAFVLGIKSRIDVATAWVKAGKTHAEIVASIAAGELV
jgi:predicted hydrocarbon binding protein